MAGLESELERKSHNPRLLKIIRPLWGLGFSTKIELCSDAKAPLRQMQDRYDDFIMIDRRAVDSPQPHRDVNPKKRKPLVYRAGVKRPF